MASKQPPTVLNGTRLGAGPSTLGQILDKLKGGAFRAELLRGGVGSVLVKLVHTGLGLLLAVVLARSMGPEHYGIYTFALAIVSLLAMPAQLGLPQLVIRETAKAQVHERWALMRGLWRWSTYAVWVASCVIALLALLIAWAIDLDFASNRSRTIVIGFLLVPLVALGNLRGAALKGLRRVVLGQLPESVLRPAFLIALVGGLWWAEGEVTSTQAVSLHAVTALAAFFIGAVLLWRARPPQLRITSRCEYNSAQWMTSTLPLALIAGLQLINNQADILMLGVLRPADEVGVYKVVVAAGTLMAFGLQIVNVVMSPHVARLYNQGDMKTIQKLITTCLRAMLLFSLPLAMIFLLWGETFLGLVFGEQYKVGYVALLILVGGQLVNVIIGPVGILMNMSGHERITLWAVIMSSVSNVLLNIFLIPVYGIEGAAFSTLLTLVILNVYMKVMVKRMLGLEMLKLSAR